MTSLVTSLRSAHWLASSLKLAARCPVSGCWPSCTRSQRTASQTEYSKSALTDHANQANHTIDWKKTTVIDREQDRPTRWIREVVPVLIRKDGNRDEGSYQLSHAYDRFLDATADRRIKTWKN